MYSQDGSFLGDRQNIRPPLNIRLDTQYLYSQGNYLPNTQPNTSRSQSNDYSMLSPTAYPSPDRTMMSVKTPGYEYAQEPIRGYPQQPRMSNFAPQPTNMNLPALSRPVRGTHQRTGSNPIFMPAAPVNINPMTGSVVHPNHAGYMQMNGNYGNAYSPMAHYKEPYAPFGGVVGDDKVLKFLERQNAVIEKLAIRIQQEERETIQRERRELEQKLRDLQAEKIMRQDSMKPLSTEESMSTKRDRLRDEKAREQRQSNNALETIGKFYLMSKLFTKGGGGGHKRSVTDPDIQKLFSKGLLSGAGLMDNPVLPEADDGDEESRKSSPFKDEPGRNYNSRTSRLGDSDDIPLLKPKHPLQSVKGSSVRNLTDRLDRKRQDNQPPFTNDHSLEDIPPVEDNDQDYQDVRKPPVRRDKSQKTLKGSQVDLKGKKGQGRMKIDDDKAQAALDDLRNQQNKKKLEARKRLKGLLWCINYPHLLFDDVRRKVEAQKERIQKQMSGNIQMNFELAQNFLLSVGEKFIKEMVLETKSLELYSPKKSISESDLNARTTMIFNYLKGFFDKLIIGTNTNNLPPNFIRFLASISEDGGVLPHNFMFDFEVKRLQFTYYATLKGMNPLKSKMVIGLFILLRVLLHQIVMRPWTVIRGLKKEKLKMKNIHTIGSIMYHTVLDFFRGNVVIVPNNQVFLPADLKVKARTLPLEALDSPNDFEEEVQNKKEDPKNKEVEPINGFLSKDQLKCLFVDRKKLYDQLKALVDGWLEKIYELTHKVYLNTPKEKRETLGIPL